MLGASPPLLRAICTLVLTANFGAQAIAQTKAMPESERALYRGEYQQAARLAEQHLQKHPRDSSARVILARAALAQGDFQSALRELQRTLASDPRNIDAHYYLALVAKVLSQQQYQRLFALAPDSHRVHQLMAEAALAAEKHAEAEAEFQAALKIQPSSVEVLTELAELKRMQSNFDEAITYYARAEQAGTLDYDIAYGLGACYTYKQDYPRAIEYLQRAVNFVPDSAAARFALGNALFQGGRIEAAIPELKASLQLESQLKQAYFVLGRAYQKLNRRDEAKEAFRQLDEINRQEAANREKKSTEQKPSSAAPAPR